MSGEALRLTREEFLRISANVNTDFAHREHLRNEIGVGG